MQRRRNSPACLKSPLAAPGLHGNDGAHYYLSRFFFPWALSTSTSTKGSIGPRSGSVLSAKDIVVYAAGGDGANGNIGSDPRSVDIGSNAVIAANIYAPNGTLLFRDGTTATGAFVVRDLQVDQDVTLSLDSGFPQ